MRQLAAELRTVPSYLAMLICFKSADYGGAIHVIMSYSMCQYIMRLVIAFSDGVFPRLQLMRLLFSLSDVPLYV